jgi:hypothetical protein
VVVVIAIILIAKLGLIVGLISGVVLAEVVRAVKVAS